jgi:hypothetical protein
MKKGVPFTHEAMNIIKNNWVISHFFWLLFKLVKTEDEKTMHSSK